MKTYNNSVLKYIKYELYNHSLILKYMKYEMYNQPSSINNNKNSTDLSILKLNINQLYERFYIHKIKKISFEYIYIIDGYKNIIKLETYINYYGSGVLKGIPFFPVNSINLYRLNEKILKI